MNTRLLSVLIIVLALGSLSGCLNTPTIPVPPPMDSSFISEPSGPDELGWVWVHADPGAIPPWEQATRIRGRVWNLETGDTVAEDLNPDGSFDTWILADHGDRLLLQGLYEFHPGEWVSNEGEELVVP